MKDNSTSAKWVLLIYFLFCFYYFGVIMMTYFISYPQMSKVHENSHDYLQVFNDKMLWFSTIPSILMLISSLFLVRFYSGIFNKWLIWSSALLAIITVSTTLFIILPIHNKLPLTGFSEAIQRELLSTAMNLQILPAVFQVLIAFGLLNIYFKESKPIERWLFISVFSLSLYTWGTLYMESLVGYPMWKLIAPSEWMATRETVGLNIPVFKWVFLIPDYLPLLLLIPMFWKRPIGISRYYVAIMFVTLLWIFLITAMYFVPNIQLKLGESYSKQLIDDLNKYDFPLRGVPGLIYFATVLLMFLKIKRKETV
ncbi:hypothetical protein OIU83_19045 [Flavobacterium sp. LS1R49]|uniref:Uncharacterized protein n=1 Tax=Flavobacterium shii TaxID=2987687 RepID=A0A9X2ZJE6_9FLAO|nr:hypothetical protein [Flavobacterium shii]MCV9929766.1 hypothetical protein [Flavobacterium shii]